MFKKIIILLFFPIFLFCASASSEMEQIKEELLSCLAQTEEIEVENRFNRETQGIDDPEKILDIINEMKNERRKDHEEALSQNVGDDPIEALFASAKSFTKFVVQKNENSFLDKKAEEIKKIITNRECIKLALTFCQSKSEKQFTEEQEDKKIKLSQDKTNLPKDVLLTYLAPLLAGISYDAFEARLEKVRGENI